MNTLPTRRWPLLFRFGVYLTAVAVAYLLASVTATQSVLASLSGMGVDINLFTRLMVTLQDLAGLAGALLPLIAAAYLIAFLVAGLLCRWWPQWRTVLYVAAGAAALVVMHLTLNYTLGITPVAIARTAGGLLVQGLAGAVGGFVFARLLRTRPQ